MSNTTYYELERRKSAFQWGFAYGYFAGLVCGALLTVILF